MKLYIFFKLLHNKIIPMEKAHFKLIIIRNMTLKFFISKLSTHNTISRQHIYEISNV
jgi:hypothetical protein